MGVEKFFQKLFLHSAFIKCSLIRIFSHVFCVPLSFLQLSVYEGTLNTVSSKKSVGKTNQMTQEITVKFVKEHVTNGVDQDLLFGNLVGKESS